MGKPGSVRVPGVATDLLGRTFSVHAEVVVDTITATLPGRAKTYLGGEPALPETVVGVGDHGGRADLPVTWNPTPDGAFDAVGVVTLDGVAEAVDGEIEWDGSGAPVVDVPVSAGPADAVRVVMTARPSGYMTLSEIEVLAAAPGVSSDATAASIEVAGARVEDFDPDVTVYRVPGAPGTTDVTAAASDPYASVDVRHGERGDRPVVFVTVTSEDGSQTREYQVELLPR